MSQRFLNGVFAGIAIGSIVSIVGLRVYQLGWHPELTEAEAFRQFWMVYLMAAAGLVVSFMWGKG